MTDTADAGATPADTNDNDANTDQTGEGDQPDPKDTVDYWKQKSRENEKRAKANATAAERLAELENANKTEAERAAERLAAAEQTAAQAQAEALRFRIATKYGISDDLADSFLTGTDEESLTGQAEKLVALSKPGTPRPDPSQGAASGAASADMNTIIRRQLRGG